jgi:hypothetical protein
MKPHTDRREKGRDGFFIRLKKSSFHLFHVVFMSMSFDCQMKIERLGESIFFPKTSIRTITLLRSFIRIYYVSNGSSSVVTAYQIVSFSYESNKRSKIDPNCATFPEKYIHMQGFANDPPIPLKHKR